MLAFKVHQRNFSVVPRACTRTRPLNFILDIKCMHIRRWRLLETLIMRALILNFANFAKHTTVVHIFRILKGIRDRCWVIHAFRIWISVLEILNLAAIVARGVIVIDQNEIFVFVAVCILFIRLRLYNVALFFLLGSLFKHFLPKRAFECYGVTANIKLGRGSSMTHMLLGTLVLDRTWTLEVWTLSIHALTSVDGRHLKVLNTGMWVHRVTLSHWNT